MRVVVLVVVVVVVTTGKQSQLPGLALDGSLTKSNVEDPTLQKGQNICKHPDVWQN